MDNCDYLVRFKPELKAPICQSCRRVISVLELELCPEWKLYHFSKVTTNDDEG